MPIGLTGDGLPSDLLYEPKLLEDVDVVPLEAVVAADVLPLPRLLELPPDPGLGGILFMLIVFLLIIFLFWVLPFLI